MRYTEGCVDTGAIGESGGDEYWEYGYNARNEV
jgi:hypothetical protein